MSCSTTGSVADPAWPWPRGSVVVKFWLELSGAKVVWTEFRFPPFLVVFVGPGVAFEDGPGVDDTKSSILIGFSIINTKKFREIRRNEEEIMSFFLGKDEDG